MGRPDRRCLGQRGQPPQRSVLQPGQLLRLIGAGQIGAGGATDDQRPTGEHSQALRPIEQLEGQVLTGMAGRRQGPQRHTAQVHLITVGQPLVRELPAAGGRCQQLRAVERSWCRHHVDGS